MKFCRQAAFMAVLSVLLPDAVRASSFTLDINGVSTTKTSQFSAGDAFNGGHTGGNLGAGAFVFSNAPFAPRNVFNSAYVRATADIDDMMIQGPPGTIVANLTIPFHAFFVLGQQAVSLEGVPLFGVSTADVSMAAGTVQPGQGQPTVFSGNVDATLSLDDHLRTNVANLSGAEVVETDSGIQLTQMFTTPIKGTLQSAVFAGVDKQLLFELSGSLTGPFTVIVGRPFTLHLDLLVSTTATADTVASAGTQADATHTFGLPQGVPIFGLPQGYTAQAPSIGLVNNVIPASAVPEPGTLVLTLLGCAACLRRRRGAGRRV